LELSEILSKALLDFFPIFMEIILCDVLGYEEFIIRDLSLHPAEKNKILERLEIVSSLLGISISSFVTCIHIRIRSTSFLSIIWMALGIITLAMSIPLPYTTRSKTYLYLFKETLTNKRKKALVVILILSLMFLTELYIGL